MMSTSSAPEHEAAPSSTRYTADSTSSPSPVVSRPSRLSLLSHSFSSETSSPSLPSTSSCSWARPSCQPKQEELQPHLRHACHLLSAHLTVEEGWRREEAAWQSERAELLRLAVLTHNAARRELQQKEEQLGLLHSQTTQLTQRASRAEEDSAQLRLYLAAVEDKASADAAQHQRRVQQLLSRLQELEARDAEWRRHDEEREEKWSEHRDTLRSHILTLQHIAHTASHHHTHLLSQPTPLSTFDPTPSTPLPQPPASSDVSLAQLEATQEDVTVQVSQRPSRSHRSVSISEAVTVIDGLSSSTRLSRRTHSTPLPSRPHPTRPSLCPLSPPLAAAATRDCIIAVDVCDAGRSRTTNLCLVTLHTQPTSDGTRTAALSPRWLPAESLEPSTLRQLLHHAAVQHCRLCHMSALHSLFTTRRQSDPLLSNTRHRVYRFANAYDPVSRYHFLCAFLAQFPLMPGAGVDVMPYFDSEPSTGRCTDCEVVGSGECRAGVLPMWKCGRCGGGEGCTRGTCGAHWSGQWMHVDSGYAACCGAALTDVRARWAGAEGEGTRQWMRTFDSAFPMPGPSCRHNAHGRTDLHSLSADADNALRTLAEHRLWLEAQGLTVRQLDEPARKPGQDTGGAVLQEGEAVESEQAAVRTRRRRQKTTTAASGKAKRSKTEKAAAKERIAARPAAEGVKEDDEVGAGDEAWKDEREGEERVEKVVPLAPSSTRRRTRAMSRLLGQSPPRPVEYEWEERERGHAESNSAPIGVVDLTQDDDEDDPNDRLPLTSVIRTHSAPLSAGKPLPLALLAMPKNAEMPMVDHAGLKAEEYAAVRRRRRLTHAAPRPAPVAEDEGEEGQHVRTKSRPSVGLRTPSASALRSTKKAFTFVAPLPSPAPSSSATHYTLKKQQQATPSQHTPASAVASPLSSQLDVQPAAVVAPSSTSRLPLAPILHERLLHMSNARMGQAVSELDSLVHAVKSHKQKTPKRKQQNADLSNHRAAQRPRR